MYTFRIFYLLYIFHNKTFKLGIHDCKTTRLQTVPILTFYFLFLSTFLYPLNLLFHPISLSFYPLSPFLSYLSLQLLFYTLSPPLSSIIYSILYLPSNPIFVSLSSIFFVIPSFPILSLFLYHLYAFPPSSTPQATNLSMQLICNSKF